MKNAILIVLLICAVGVKNLCAQSENVNWNAYISDKMAQKIADGILKAYPSNEREMRIQLFMNANNISSVSTCADILHNLENHKDAAANFILAIFSSSPMITPAYFFQSIGFNEIEIEMAVKAGEKKQELLRDKKKRDEQAEIERWKKEGKYITFSSNYDKELGQVPPKFVFFPKLFGISDTVIIQPEGCGRYVLNPYEGDVEIRFVVSENGEISNDFREKIKQYGMDSICVLHPAEKRFERLDTVIPVPSANYFGVHGSQKHLRDVNKSYVATVKFDKKTGKWIMKECENRYGQLKDWFVRSRTLNGSWESWSPKETMGFDSYDDITAWMNSYFNGILQGKEGKKYQIEFTFVPMEIYYYINRCLIGRYDLKQRIQINKIEKK